ncbi:YadA family autotransporter adhesin, partial [Neisseria cinerea]|uniref:YadA family autotransporter adhesin n=1 Tax=Neisseria cinerea TaxID=483 RepID=UPI0027E0BF9E
KGDVIASMNNGDNKTNKPMQLANIGSNLPMVNDTNKQAFDPNSTTPKAGKDNKSAPITAKEAADIVNKAGNNAATVSDVLNAGWNLQNNGEARDFVKPYDTVNFINGKGTVAVVETADDAASSTVKFDVDAGEITSNTNGSVNGPTTAENAKKLADDLKKAEQAVKDLPADATEDKKAEAQKALKDAQDAAAPLNKVATAQNVADMINASGFTLKTSATADGKKESGNDEIINPGKAVEMVAGKNLTVKQEANGKVTYSTKDDVSFNTVNVGDNTYVDADGKPVTKNADGTYTDSKGQPIEEGKVTKLAPVAMKAEKAKPATNNGNKAEDQPTTALNVSSSDGKPTQITGVGSTLNVKPVDTNPNGTPTADADKPKLVDLVGTDAAPVNKNAAATVGDLQNMGWVVSTKDGNGYTDVVKNANQVDFKGGTGISVKGETTKDGVREITISVKDGEVIKPNQFTAKVNGTDTPVTKVGDQYYNTADIDPKTGKPKANVTPVTPDAGTTPTNAGDGYVTGNKVAAAIQKSGFVVGKQKDALSAADFKDEDEKVNPDDELRFADGNNTKVKLATKESVDKDGNKVTTTTVKVDVTGLPVQYTDKNGTPVTKVGDKYFTVDDKGNPTATEVKPADLTTNMVNPAAAPNAIGAPTTLGNVKSNLPSVNDADKNAKDVAGKIIDDKDNKSAPITAKEAADIANKAGNNAATVSDVLNAGWNLQNNGEARDFVKPYDTVNFINGKGTVAVVETADNAASSTVKFDVDAGEITAETKDGKATGKVVGLIPADKKPADLLKAVEDAQKAVDKLAKDAAATPEAKKAAQDALKAAQDAAAPLNKVATAQNVADMINASGFTLKTSATADGKKESGNDEIINPGKAVEMVAGKNLTVTQDKNGKVTYATANDVNFNSLSLGTSQHAPTLSADEDGSLRLGSKGNQAPVRISNVAPGIKDGDAVNVSQLKGVTKDLEDKIDGVAAGSNAAASLPQVYLPGKSMVAASVGTYGSQGALAVGYSSISDNGKWLIKGQVNVNTKAKTGGGVGVGYLW